MAKIDLERFISDFMSFTHDLNKGETKDFSSKQKNVIKASTFIVGEAIRNAIEKQGLTYKDGKIVEIEPKQESSELEAEQNWKDLRNQAAIAAMQGVMNFFGSIDYNRETIARLAVEQADALIAELRKESNYEKDNPIYKTVSL